MLISFAWTTKAIRDRTKFVTRRQWTPGYASRFHAGDLVDAYDKNPRNGGKPIDKIKLSCDPYREALRDMPEADLALEGGLWADKKEFIEGFGGDPELVVWVVRFEYPDTSRGKGGVTHEDNLYAGTDGVLRSAVLRLQDLILTARS